MKLVWRALDGLWVALFVLSAAVQYNDPDPVQWMALYLAAALVAGWSAKGNVKWQAAAAVGAAALAWALVLLPGIVGSPGFPDFGVGRGMFSPSVEETRETGGLLLTTAWMAVVAVRAGRAKKPA